MKILVTGATGFLGRAVSEDLLERHDLLLVTRRVTDLPARCLLVDPSLPDMGLGAGIETFQPERVVHFATAFSPNIEVSAMVEANIRLGAQILHCVSRLPHPPPILHATSVFQHFENEEYSPVSFYAATKQAFCDIARFFSEVEGLDITEMLLGDTYGPNDPRGKIISTLISLAHKPRPIELSGGEQWVDPVHARDVVKVVRQWLELTPAYPRRFQLTSPRPLTLRDLVATVEAVTGRQIPAVWGAKPYRKREIFSPVRVADPPPHWDPQPLEAGLLELWEAASRE